MRTQAKFVENTANRIKELEIVIAELYKQNKINTSKKDNLIYSLNRVKDYLPWCKDYIHSDNMIEQVKDIMNEVYGEINKKGEDEMGKKHRKHKQYQQTDFAEKNYLKNSTSLETVPIRDIKFESEEITVGGDKAKFDKFITEPIIYIYPEVYEKIMIWTKLLDDEVTGLGTVKELGNGVFFIESMYLFNQKVSKAVCEAEDLALIELCERIEKDGHNPADIKVWWHSHNSMGVSPSAKDDETGRNYCSNGYLISLITNHAGEMYSKMNIFKPIDLIIENISVQKLDPKPAESIIESCKADIEKYVKKEKYFAPAYQNFGYGYGYVNPSFRTPILPSSLQQAKEEINEMHEQVQDTEDESKYSGPWGTEFTENNVRYVWDKMTQRYLFYCTLTGKEISEDEIESFGGYNYNKFYEGSYGL